MGRKSDDELQDFLARWHDTRTTLTVHTSGSTGVPKALEVEKERMRASACMTCEFLGLQPKDTALLCLPLQYIAGMMMAVRADVWGLRIINVDPSNHPLAGLTEVPTFAAMVPSQVYETLQVESERNLFSQIRHVIIGGGAIDVQLEKQLRNFPNRIWHSYGMTETLSHIAMRDIHEQWFYPLPDICIEKDNNDCLIINAPHLCPETLHTHDIVSFNDKGGFVIKGRSDNVICSGGIKIQIEEVESALQPIFGQQVMVTSMPDEKFGEAVVYLVEQSLVVGDTTGLDTSIWEKIEEAEQFAGKHSFPRHWRPKHICMVDQLPRTGTGKPDRAKAKEMALQN